MAGWIFPLPGPVEDYEFVIRAFGWRRMRRPKFIPWSAQNRPPTDKPSTGTQDTIMKTPSLIAVVALAFAGSAFAQEATSDAWMGAAATKSRAEVQAELQQARATGLTKAWSAGYMEKMNSTQSRADVALAARTARVNGEADRINAEAWHFEGQLPANTAGTRLAQAAR
jgi:hypothetical protein